MTKKTVENITRYEQEKLSKRAWNPDDPDLPDLRPVDEINELQAKILATIKDKGNGLTAKGGQSGDHRADRKGEGKFLLPATTRRNDYGWALREMDDELTTLVTPNQLLEKFFDYSEWVADNPLQKPTLIPKTGEIVNVPQIRAMSARAFCLWAGYSEQYLGKLEKKHRFAHIVTAIKSAMYTQKFEYGAANMLNAGIVMRDLGLNEKVTVEHDDKRKTVDDLFPSVDLIQAQEAEIVETKELPYESED